MTGNTASVPAFRVRWRIFSLLASVAMVAALLWLGVDVARPLPGTDAVVHA